VSCCGDDCWSEGGGVGNRSDDSNPREGLATWPAKSSICFAMSVLVVAPMLASSGRETASVIQPAQRAAASRGTSDWAARAN
jgi:hypothetical protein